MNNVTFLFSLIGLLILAACFVWYPLRQNKLLSMGVFSLFMMVAMLGYWRWGAWSDWVEYVSIQTRKQHVQALLKTIEGPEALIDQLKTHLMAHPDSARGWYLLGRLYAGQQSWIKARDVFQTAYQLKPEDEAITINYAQSLWQVHQQQFDDTIRGLFQSVLRHNSNQPDALAMLAIDAYMSHDYQSAIKYWQRLLAIVPDDSEDAKAIRQAIAAAFSSLK